MSLRGKIIFSFFVSSIIMVLFAQEVYVNFLEIRKEIRYLELTDTLRSKSLQLRRHEKNFFLYSDKKELADIHSYIGQLKSLLAEGLRSDSGGKLAELRTRVAQYDRVFGRIEEGLGRLQREFDALKPQYPRQAEIFALIESSVLERPALIIGVVDKSFPRASGGPLPGMLRELDGEIVELRKSGEEILNVTKGLDKQAREKVERHLSLVERAGVVLLPLFLLVSLSVLLLIARGVIKRLKMLTHAIEKTGKGTFATLPVASKEDEVGLLIGAFNEMEENLIAREKELKIKNEELLRSRKLAAIGTLASGVAHELNNPLNNIYLAAQILSKEVQKQGPSEIITETVNDISSQALRVKRIVSDLLSFTREKPIETKPLVLPDVIGKAFKQLLPLDETSSVRFALDAPPDAVVKADEALMEQVFVNLFGNALDAMQGKGLLSVTVKRAGDALEISVSDTGKGIQPENLTKIFDPFFTTKDKGTGLGLSIVYNIIDKHGGTINVESAPGKGTTFKITLPI